MSATIASGASNPNGAGLPMLSLRILCPSASSRCASVRIGPRTSYLTCCSLRLWTIGRMRPVSQSAERALGDIRLADVLPGRCVTSSAHPGPSRGPADEDEDIDARHRLPGRGRGREDLVQA